jgi:hypothetical protein
LARAIVHAVDTSANSPFHRLSMSASAFASSFDAGSPSACENAAIFLRVRLRAALHAPDIRAVDMSDFCEDILRNTIAFPFVPHCLAERSHELVA